MDSYRFPTASGRTHRSTPSDGFMRRESFSSSHSFTTRPRWYYEVPILRSFLHTIQDILGSPDHALYQKIGQRRPSRSKMIFEEDDPRGSRRRRGSPTRTRYHISSSSGLRSQRGRTMDSHDKPSLNIRSPKIRSSSNESYRRPNPLNSPRSAPSGPKPGRRVTFRDPPMESPIPPQNGSGSSRSRNRNENRSSWCPSGQQGRSSPGVKPRADRERSPVNERKPHRRGQRIDPFLEPSEFHDSETDDDVVYIPMRKSQPYARSASPIVVEASPNRTCPRESQFYPHSGGNIRTIVERRPKSTKRSWSPGYLEPCFTTSTGRDPGDCHFMCIAHPSIAQPEFDYTYYSRRSSHRRDKNPVRRSQSEALKPGDTRNRDR